MPRSQKKARAVRPKTTERKRKILEAALSCFTRYGFQATTIEDICKAAAISPGHLYYYYASKEALIQAVADQHLNANRSMLESTAGMDDLLSRFLSADYVKSRQPPSMKPTFSLEMIAESARNEALRKIVQEHGRNNIVEVDRFLQRAKDHGEIDPDVDPLVLRTALLMYWAAHPVLLASNPDFDERHYEATLQLLLKPFLRPAKAGRRKTAAK